MLTYNDDKHYNPVMTTQRKWGQPAGSKNKPENKVKT